jgi:hypothetical protein
VRQYCSTCHNDQLQTGNVSLQGFDVDRAAEKAPTAERMIRKLRAGMMPPPGMPRPSPDTLLALVETLETNVDKAAAASPNVGGRRFTRLTRAEYNRVIKDLLGLDVDASQWLPPDVTVGVFDNTATAQALSPTLLDAFLRAANEISRMALGNPQAVSLSKKFLNPKEVSQHPWDHVEGTPFGTRGGVAVTYDFPADGKYVFTIETDFGDPRFEEDLDLSIDGQPVAQMMMPHKGAQPARVQGGSAGLGAEVQTEPIAVTAGQHQVSAAFVNQIEGMYDDQFSAPKWSQSGSEGGKAGITGLAHLTAMEITGPTDVKGVTDNDTRKRIFTCHPTAADQERACAESILSSFATKAYRRPVTSQDVAGLMKFYDQGLAEGGFEVGVRTGLQAVLSSPEFVFRLERQPADARPGQGYRLSDLDLATRLSFFLWATSPDQQLMDLAEKGKLSDPAVLRAQVARMLKDPRAEALSTRFFAQWLKLQDVGKVWPDAYLHPEFSKQLAQSMVRESEMLFQHLVDEDRPLLELFNADYSFLNERLAEHYGIDGVQGDELRLVMFPADSPRRGIFGHGSILQLTSMSDRTSPVLRGKWVMEVLMGTPPPPPPPNVPTLEQTAGSSGTRRLTTRERMEQHRKNPVCSSCHNFIDPIGLALDNFDATGKWRIHENRAPLDTRGMFYDGTPVSTPTELANVLLKRPIPLVRQFTGNLLSYAIGRPIEYYDQPAVRKIAKDAEANGYRLTSFIIGVVQSPTFQMRQTQATSQN